MATTSADETLDAGSSSSASTPPTTTKKATKTGPKPKAPVTLHPAHEKAVKYATFMLSDEGQEQTPTEFIQDAVSRHLTYIQKQGIEFPPKLLADLTRLNLVK